jgi:hypothetical protein
MTFFSFASVGGWAFVPAGDALVRPGWISRLCLNPGRVFTLDGRIKHSRIALCFISQRLRFMTAG